MIAKLRGLLRHVYAVPWCVPAWGSREAIATLGSLATGRIKRGRSINRFVAGVRALLDARYALPVNRGRTAIEVALRALSIGPGDDVVLPSYICRSVLDAVLLAEANPVFADVDESLNVNAVTVAAALTPATKAVIVAHLFGNAAPIDEIEALLAGRGIAVIDDAAQALGARRGGRLVGTFGTFGIVSCGPGKPLAGAAGGLLVTNDASLAAGAAQVSLTHEASSVVASRALEFWVWRRFRRLTLPVRAILDRLVGEQAEPPHLRSPLSNLDAGIAFAQLRALERHAGERRANARLMLARLTGLPGRTITDLSADGAAVKLIWLLPPTGPPVRDVVAALARNGIEAQGGYVPAHLGVSNDAAVPTTMELWRRVLCIPLETRTPSTTPIGFGETPAPRPADETASALSRG